MPLQYIFTNMFSKLLSAKYGFFLIMPREALLIIWELCCNTANVPHAIHDHMFCTCKDIIILLFGSCLHLCKLNSYFIIYHRGGGGGGAPPHPQKKKGRTCELSFLLKFFQFSKRRIHIQISQYY